LLPVLQQDIIDKAIEGHLGVTLILTLDSFPVVT
jgi:hypothetical protein